MKRIVRFLPTAAVILFLSGCGVNTSMIPIATEIPGVETALPEAQAPEYIADQKTVTLYFRYGDTDLLAPEIRQISVTQDTSLEEKILSELVGGPGSHSAELNALFPAGTRVRNVTREKRTLFVTLTSELMSVLTDENVDPDNEALALERYLMIQSLVGTMTENCDVDEVQILLSEKENSAERLPASFFMTGEVGPSGPVTRDSTLFLTPEVTMEVLLESWRNEDWTRIYPFLYQAQDDRLSCQDLIARMNGLPAVSDYRLNGSSISSDGSTATFSADMTIRYRDGTVMEMKGRTIRLKRISGMWKTDYDLLTGWVVDQQ